MLSSFRYLHLINSREKAGCAESSSGVERHGSKYSSSDAFCENELLFFTINLRSSHGMFGCRHIIMPASKPYFDA